MNDTKPEQHKIRLFESVDPTWPCYGVSEPARNTQWFKTYAEAEQYAADRASKTDGIVITS